ncbi:unnamed protein product [Cyprideis torosa]|uniref:Uncharacterized protein n=1 Tax=Cyprideis torosa TaxID=163714 RepID=A0A7R8WD49_9CRUS|nr:unnamed protein product [Cyprideis torosa]CAG0894182.1 unnamed protein product [Cyprideis torosa]
MPGEVWEKSRTRVGAAPAVEKENGEKKVSGGEEECARWKCVRAKGVLLSRPPAEATDATSTGGVAENGVERKEKSSSRNPPFTGSGNRMRRNEEQLGSQTDGITKKLKDLNVAENDQISKKIRRLSREDDSISYILQCRKIKECLLSRSNFGYIRRALSDLLSWLAAEIDHLPQKAANQAVIECLGAIGYVLENDYRRFLSWVFDYFPSLESEQLKIPYYQALYQMLILYEKNPCSLKVPRLLVPDLIKNVLDASEEGDDFAAFANALDVLIQTSKVDPYAFRENFSDVMDLMIGWSIVPSLRPRQLSVIHGYIKELAHVWKAKVDFTMSITEQILEDIGAYLEFIKSHEESSATEKKQNLLRLAALYAILDTVLHNRPRKGRTESSTTLCTEMLKHFSEEYFSRFLSVCLGMAAVLSDDEMTVEYVSQALHLVFSLPWTVLPDAKVTANLSLLLNFLTHSLSSSLVTCKDSSTVNSLRSFPLVVKRIGSNLPPEFVPSLFKSDDAPLKVLRRSPNPIIVSACLDVFVSLLSLKSIPVMQSTYSQLVDDLENGDHPTQMFALAALTPVANLRYSFIAMLALSPPIFKLLLTKATSIQDSRTKDQFQSARAALALLFSHCQCHSHFVSSSSLFSSPMATAISSPSSSLLSFSPASEPLAPLRTPLGPTTPSSNEHPSANTSPGPDSMLKTATEGLLAEELKLLLALFKADSKMSPGPREEVLSLSLPWFMAVLSSLPKDPPAAHSEEFLALSAPFVPVLVSVAHELIGKDTDTAAASSMLQCLDCILHLLSLQHECMNDSTTSMICRLCFTLLRDKDEAIRTMVAKLLGYVPFRILQTTFKEQSMWQLSPSSTETMSTASRSIMARAVLFPSLDRRDFALLMDAWFFHPTNPQPDINRMIRTAPRSADPRAALRPPILEALLSRPSLASLWAAWQTAGFFVAAKLKTDLGKPSNAFSGISNAVNALPPLFKCQPRPSLFKRGKEVLLFVDALERVTYNAGSGTALALPSPNQVVQGFFHTNRHVTEGFLRQWREGLLTVALEIEDPAAGVWHGTKLLQGLREGQEALIETTVYRVAACYALLHETGSINGSDEIHGFAMWIKAKFGKEFDWLQAMEAQAAGNFESAIRLYHREIRQRVSRKQDQTEDWMWQRLSRQVGLGAVEPAARSLGVGPTLGECHLRIGEYHDAQDWWERLSPSETNHLDHRFLSALSQFNEEGPLFLPPPAPVFVPSLTDNESRELPGEDFWSLQRWKSEACLELLRTCVQCTVPSNTALSSLKISESLFAFHPRRSSMMKLFWGRRLLRSSSLLEPEEVELCDSSDLILCLNWLDLQRRNDDARNVKPGLLRNLYQNLCLAGAKKARLDGNLRLAQRLLDRGTEREAHLPPTVRARFVREAVQLVLSGESVSKDAFDSLPVLLDSILSCLRDASLPFDVLTPQGERTALEETAASLLLYARVARRAGDERVEHFITPEVTALCHKHQASNPPVPSLAHMDLVGLLLHTPVALAPSSSAAWAQWAEWCFSRGEEEVQRLKSGSASTPADAAHFLPASLPDAAREGIWHALTEHWARSLPTHSQDPVILSSLQSSILGHLSSSPEAAPCLRQLVLFWMRRREEALAFHLAATHAYFAFLKLEADESRSSFACVAATLRLHHLLVKHAGALQKEMEAGLADTPCGPWKAILPQLFSRLIHPQPFARLAITDLLSRIAVGESHLIVFPAVVGALGVEEGTATDLLSVDEGWRGVLGGGYQQAPPESNGPGAEGEGEMDGPPEEERSGEHERRGNEAHLMRNCLLSLLDSLKRKNREGMEEVQVLIRELRRISVLWEELWLGTLQQIHGEVSRRIKLLEEEYEKLKKNQSLSRDERDSLMRAKHRILFAPVLFALDQLASLTSAAPETRNERMFQERYIDDVILLLTDSWIQSALRSVREASSPLQPGACWSGFRSLEKSLVDRASRRGAALLRMEHISPVLYAMKGTSVVLPGRSNTLGVRSSSPVCIAGVENSVTILPTKTRPKKLAFVGHNGRRYHYLFKGLEDLHLDERAMQFLSILNTLFASEARRGQDPFRACHYSVTPLGPRSGLIQWVEGGTPLFGLYRRWYQRRFELKEGAILRPSEIFMRKLQPHLKGSNLSPESRKDWPAHILRSVLLELMNETPTDILANEIWAFSRDAQEWLRNTERYTRSTAVMSMVGYVLGLGDRHLDNLLVDLHSGEIIHIDYNVCFEKGLSLKIPENVPFRLTPNIVGAMGVSGLEVSGVEGGDTLGSLSGISFWGKDSSLLFFLP